MGISTHLSKQHHASYYTYFVEHPRDDDGNDNTEIEWIADFY